MSNILYINSSFDIVKDITDAAYIYIPDESALDRFNDLYPLTRLKSPGIYKYDILLFDWININEEYKRLKDAIRKLSLIISKNSRLPLEGSDEDVL